MILIFAGSTDVLSADHTSRFVVPFLLWLDPHMSWATITQIHFAIRKLGHLTEYAILAVLLWRAFRGTLTGKSLLLVSGIALLISALFAMSDEFHQTFVPARTASVHDVLIDVCGAMFGLILCVVLARRRALTRSF